MSIYSVELNDILYTIKSSLEDSILYSLALSKDIIGHKNLWPYFRTNEFAVFKILDEFNEEHVFRITKWVL
jgi:hypothetical protein